MAMFALSVLKKKLHSSWPHHPSKFTPPSCWVFHQPTCHPFHPTQILGTAHHGSTMNTSSFQGILPSWQRWKTTWIHQQLQIGGGGRKLCCRFHYTWWRSKCSLLIKNGSPALPHDENSRMSLESKRDHFFPKANFMDSNHYSNHTRHVSWDMVKRLQGGYISPTFDWRSQLPR